MFNKLITTLMVLSFLLHPCYAQDDSTIDLESASSQEPTSLNKLIEETITKNPILLSLGHQITAQSAKSVWIKALPDPIFTNASNTSKAPFRYDNIGSGPMNQVQFVLGQSIPFPGKLKLKGRVEKSELESINQSFELNKLKLISRLKRAYYNLFFTSKSLEITEEIKLLLEQIEKTVKAKYEVGNGNQHDLLKVQLEISSLLEKIVTLKKDRELFIAEINSIAIRPQGTDIGKIEEVKKQPLNYKLTELIELSKNQYPYLLRQKALIEKGQYSVKLAKKEYYPDFSFTGVYGLRTDPFPDMYTVQLSSSIPLYFRTKQKKQVEDAIATLKAEEERYHSIIVEAEYRIKDLFVQLEKHNELMDLLSTGIIPQARLAVDASIAAYKVDKSDFLNLLDNIRALLNFQIEYYDHLTKYQKAIAELEPLVGRRL